VTVWRGAPALRPFLVEIDRLEPFPGNPRRGDVGEVAASLDRFGQVRAILVDGSRIVAGHHVVEAARSLGWTHVAATANDFGGEEEARAYLLADNHLGELGGYDDALLAAQLDALRGYEGTGYTVEDAERLRARLAGVREPAAPAPARPETVEVGFASPEARAAFLRLAGVLEREWGLGRDDAVARAVLEAAERT
jgi:ParB-like chromosome segregation protein Spo0J